MFDRWPITISLWTVWCLQRNLLSEIIYTFRKMSSGFVSEADLQKQRELRQQEWEKVRTEDQPIEAPEPEYDNRTLYDRLQEQKDKKQEEWDESRKFKNQIKNLDEDECNFLDMVDKTKSDQEVKIRKEENRELEEFRKEQASAEERAEEQRLKAEVQRTAAAPARPAGTKRSQSQLLAGVVKRRAREPDPAPAPSATAAAAVVFPSALRCAGVLPGVGAYTDSSDSDSDASSDISWPKPAKIVVSSASTAESHKGHGAGCGANCKG
ncbi:PSME3-interacting protein-like [Pollicipes pollicipes]|uniref:PSME3-interacting protein-like n=1 Tax=Pollicipes pollicipes TaxID=41117 RepID=UPI00188525AF|nr:PSME3-interacting protein-like [Pollicipes pollicipes]